MGVYQIRQAKSYSKEHQTDAGKYQICVNKSKMGSSKPTYVHGIPAVGHTIYG